jgi:Zn-dependent protease
MDIPVDIQQLLLVASAMSLGAVILALVGVPWVVTRLPADYFSETRRHTWRSSDDEPLFAVVIGLLKNVVGAVLVVLGLVMLVTPGQGLLTLLAGLLLMNFPGKYRLERWLVMRPGVLRALNWLRDRQGHAPFDHPQS